MAQKNKKNVTSKFVSRIIIWFDIIWKIITTSGASASNQTARSSFPAACSLFPPGRSLWNSSARGAGGVSPAFQARIKAGAEVNLETSHQICQMKIFSLKVPSGQIRSAWERYYWIGLVKDINHHRFWFFNFDLEYLKSLQSSELLHTKIQKYNLLLLRHMVCIESLFPICLDNFFRLKNPPKCCTILVCIAGCWNFSNILLTSHPPKSNWWLSRILEPGLTEKVMIWAHTTRLTKK
jgi:hypothetical protein